MVGVRYYLRCAKGCFRGFEINFLFFCMLTISWKNYYGQYCPLRQDSSSIAFWWRRFWSRRQTQKDRYRHWQDWSLHHTTVLVLSCSVLIRKLVTVFIVRNDWKHFRWLPTSDSFVTLAHRVLILGFLVVQCPVLRTLLPRLLRSDIAWWFDFISPTEILYFLVQASRLVSYGSER